MNPVVQAEQLNLVVFGDQTNNASSLVKQLLLEAPQSVAQTEFLRGASAVLRTPVCRLHTVQRKGLPPCKNVHELARLYEDTDGVCHPAISSALLCVTQLLQIFRYFERRSYQPADAENITVVGLCTGSIAAAAYAASASLEDLKLLAVPTVSMAFQIGLQAATVSSMLYEQGDSWESWSIAIANMTEDEALSALKTYNAGSHLPLHRDCYISAVGLKSITISGSPPALTSFADRLTAAQPWRKVIWLPIFAAYHGPHIHSVLDFSNFMSQCGIDANLLTNFKSVKAFLSPFTGLPVESRDALGLFKSAVLNTLQAPLRLDVVVESCVTLIRKIMISSVRILSVGPTPVADSLATVFRRDTKADISTYDLAVLDRCVDECRPSASLGSASLAIVGMSGRFPGADSTDALWSVLEAGLDLHRAVPEDRFDVDKHVDTAGTRKNTSWTPYGCFIDRPGDFDPRFFNMSPREALQTDPMQRLALVTAYEALEMAGFVAGRTRSTVLNRVGTFYGQTSDDYRETNAAQDIGTHFITGGIRAFGPGRINYFFKFGGPSYSIDTACSSSLAAIQLACTALWNGDCDTAVAGGLSVLTSPDLFAGLSRGQFLSQTGSCKAFDNNADGYCRADGIGSVIIKRLADAEMDRDNILAVILGAGTNHSADAISITHPHAETQSKLYREVLEKSGVDPLDVGYIEMHGTGTQAGDGTEMRSVVDIFGRTMPGEAEKNPLYIGAVKANVGHGEACPNSLAKDGIPEYQRHEGGNTALLLQEPPSRCVQQDIEPRPLHPITVSGDTICSFRGNLDKLLTYLSTNPNTSPVDLSYTTTARRRHHKFRLTVIDRSIEGIRSALELRRHCISPISFQVPDSKPIVFLFTGQGAVYPGLAHELYTSSCQFRADVEKFDAIAQQQGFPCFLPVLDGSAADLNLLSPAQTQIAFLCIQVALARLWSSWGITPAAVAGHSLGEYAALQLSGVISISDAIFLVGHRALLLESRCSRDSYAMLAVAESSGIVQSIPTEISSNVEIACINSPREVVFAGKADHIGKLETYLATNSVRVTKLQVPYAFHSRQVDPILDDFERIANEVDIGCPRVPIISSAAGRVLGPDDQITAQYMRRHCRHTVQFRSAIQDACDIGLIRETSMFLELGPHPICSGMVRSILGNTTQTLPTLRRKENAWEVIVKSLASLHDVGFSIDWSEYYRDIEKGCCLLALPTYAFDNKNYWIDYRNDWTLRKGEPLSGQHAGGGSMSRTERISSSVHRVVKEDYDGANPLAVFETDPSSPEIHAAISGHRVNGSSLCPSSIYADMALTIAEHIQKKQTFDISSNGYNITSMDVHHPLITNPSKEDENRVIRVYARPTRHSQTIKLEYASATIHQEAETRHAICFVTFESSDAWLRQWSQELERIQGRISTLHRLTESGNASKLTSKMAYRLFGTLVEYAPQYQRMNQVLLASSFFEATATVTLDNSGDDQSFVYSPYWTDALLHLSGFVMNANDALDYHDMAYISHGWKSLRFAKRLRPNVQYQTYVRMLPHDKSMFGGDVWILCQDEVVGLAEDVRFQRVPRAVLNMLIPPMTAKRVDEKTLLKATSSKPRPIERKQSTRDKMPLSSTAPRRDSYLAEIALELGLEASEISPQDTLLGLGVDSLVSLTLARKLSERFDHNISHNEILKCSYIRDLLDILDQGENGPNRDSTALAADGVISDQSSASSQSIIEPLTPRSSNGDPTELVKSIIMDETGLTSDELDPSVNLSTLGLDSMIGLVVLGKLREAGIDLHTTFFVEHNTMNEVFKALSSDPDVEVPQSPPPEDNPYGNKDVSGALLSQSENSFQARIVLLQRRSNQSSKQNLFLFPDGSGSPFSYAALEQLSPNFDVYGLVCPFIDSAHYYTCGIGATVKMYLSTILKQQPHGPYYFGGWSVGGVLAYEASRQVVEVKETVQSLILIDAPCPAVLPPMPSALIDLLMSKGLFSQFQDNSAPTTRTKRPAPLEHFKATVSNLALYKPSPIGSTGDAPEVLIIWGREGLGHGSRPVPDSSGSAHVTEAWILNDRMDFGPHGWETLLPVAKMSTLLVPGNHFSMMAGDNITTVSTHLQKHFSRYA
ncbi:hypothetical protein BBP40_000549 [Aspergillus hancockii]|nr:hypothetical protein BBP40_000549 [Aspergillus hancockii]